LIIYKNVLGRTGINAPPAEDVQYWAGQLATMLGSAHSFSGHPTWGWVPQFFDLTLP